MKDISRKGWYPWLAVEITYISEVKERSTQGLTFSDLAGRVLGGFHTGADPFLNTLDV